jgi:hypothetical protein
VHPARVCLRHRHAPSALQQDPPRSACVHGTTRSACVHGTHRSTRTRRRLCERKHTSLPTTVQPPPLCERKQRSPKSHSRRRHRAACHAQSMPSHAHMTPSRRSPRSHSLHDSLNAHAPAPAGCQAPGTPTRRRCDAAAGTCTCRACMRTKRGAACTGAAGGAQNAASRGAQNAAPRTKRGATLLRASRRASSLRHVAPPRVAASRPAPCAAHGAVCGGGMARRGPRLLASWRAAAPPRLLAEARLRGGAAHATRSSWCRVVRRGVGTGGGGAGRWAGSGRVRVHVAGAGDWCTLV